MPNISVNYAFANKKGPFDPALPLFKITPGVFKNMFVPLCFGSSYSNTTSNVLFNLKISSWLKRSKNCPSFKHLFQLKLLFQKSFIYKSNLKTLMSLSTHPHLPPHPLDYLFRPPRNPFPKLPCLLLLH